MGAFHIPIQKVVELLRLPMPTRGESSYYIPCPDCDPPNIRKPHLNIDLRENVFRCPKCAAGGGVLDFYSFMSGVPRENANDDLKEKLGTNFVPTRESLLVAKGPLEYPMIDIEVRDKTYRALLSKLPLSKDHEENLLSRGHSTGAIKKYMYRTFPAAGLNEIAYSLLMEGCQLLGVPGFYKKNSKWTMACYKRGILIPVLDLDSRIQGLQIRLDNSEDGKFRWFSSRGRDHGSKAGGLVHIAGPVRERVLLIEGPMKANIIHELTGQTVIAVPGVNTLKKLETLLVLLRRLGTKSAMTCFDMDMITNYNVQKGYKSLASLLMRTGLDYGTYYWNPFYNGLDDYVWALYKQRSFVAA